MNVIQSLVAAGLVSAAPLAAVVADSLPGDAKPIVEIVEGLEKHGYGPFVGIDFDDGRWEAEAYKKAVPYELAVDPRTAQILSEHRDDAEPHPPLNSKPLSSILRSLDKLGYSQIDEVSFERRYWEIESLRADGKHEVQVDPTSGEVVSDRLDD